MEDPRILVVLLRSTYTHLVSERRHPGVARLVKSGDALVEKIVAAHVKHDESISEVKRVLKERRLRSTWLGSIGELDLNEYDLVVTVGGDGTVLHASHAIGSTPDTAG